MTIKRMFINDVYDGDYKRYLHERKADYFKVQLEWTFYIDQLCKAGIITQQQYNRAIF